MREPGGFRQPEPHTAGEDIPVDGRGLHHCRNDAGSRVSRFGFTRQRIEERRRIACCKCFLCQLRLVFTTDAGILKKLRFLGTMRIANPVEFIVEDSNDNG